jgi:ureidoglycolate hydrolase
MSKPIVLKQLLARQITAENFKPYGQLILPSEHDKLFDSQDAQLKLNNGIPRFYIMRLYNRGCKFHNITRHQLCTQCLGSLYGKDWFIAVAPPSDSHTPYLADIVAFSIPGNCFIKLELGTWHSGPYFNCDFVDFYNLEMSDTNIVDRFTYDLLAFENLEFEIISN